MSRARPSTAGSEAWTMRPGYPPCHQRRAAAGCLAPAKTASSETRSIPAFYPNHIWSVDLTIVRRWGLWTTYVLVAIDHFSRKIVAVNPLDGPNAAWVCDAREKAFTAFGPPKHIITDQQSVFTGGAQHEQLGRWDVSHRLGAIGSHGRFAPRFGVWSIPR